MKHPNQFWHEYKTSVYGEAPLAPHQDLEVRRAFHAGAEATYKVLDVIEREKDFAEILEWFREQNKKLASSTLSEEAKLFTPMMDLSGLIQIFRTLRLSQIRKQLESDEKNNIDRLFYVYHFLKLAKEQQP